MPKVEEIGTAKISERGFEDRNERGRAAASKRRPLPALDFRFKLSYN
jgi:hypothetical protein